MSYDRRLHFGLLGDFDAMPDLDRLGEELASAIDELAASAGVTGGSAPASDAVARPPLGFQMPRLRATRPRARGPAPDSVR